MKVQHNCTAYIFSQDCSHRGKSGLAEPLWLNQEVKGEDKSLLQSTSHLPSPEAVPTQGSQRGPRRHSMWGLRVPARRVHCHVSLLIPGELESQKQVCFMHRRPEWFQNRPLNLIKKWRLGGTASCPTTPSQLGSGLNLDLLGLAQVVSQRPQPRGKQPGK